MENKFYTKVNNEVRTEENRIDFEVISEEDSYINSIKENSTEYINIDFKKVDTVC